MNYVMICMILQALSIVLLSLVSVRQSRALKILTKAVLNLQEIEKDRRQ